MGKEEISYVVREIGWAYEVTKWEEWTRRPLASYKVILNKDSWNECSCIGNWRWGRCKHEQTVRSWLLAGKPRLIPFKLLSFGPEGWGIS